MSNEYRYTYVKNDDRCYPRGAAAPPYDVNGVRWHDRWPEKPGWYHVALIPDPHRGLLYGLRVARMYYDGETWIRVPHPDADEFEIEDVRRTQLLPNELYEENDPLSEEEEYVEFPYYEPEYWHDIHEEMIPCRFPY